MWRRSNIGEGKRMTNNNDLHRGERLQIMLSAEEVVALDDWRFSRRMPSRAAAIRELLRRGLAAEGFATAQAGYPSQQFGVITPPPRTERKKG